MTDLNTTTIAEAARLIEAKELSPVELTEAKLALVEGLDGQLDSFVTLTADLALEKARAAEAEIAAGTYRGPLHGIPFGLKDVYNTAGIPTMAHSKILIDHVPGRDATTTGMLHAHGGVLMGKLATHEFAHGGPSFDLPWPPARNPWNTEYFTGGSSRGGRSGLGHRRFGAHPGGAFRHRRAEADLRPGQPPWRSSQLVHLRYLRPHGVDGRGLRHSIAGHRRLRPPRRVEH